LCRNPNSLLVVIGGLLILVSFVSNKKLKSEMQVIEQFQSQIHFPSRLKILTDSQVDSIPRGFDNRYGLHYNDNIRVVVDSASGLMWQGVGFWKKLTFIDAIRLMEGLIKRNLLAIMIGVFLP